MSEPGKKALELADELLMWLSCDHEGWRRKLLAEKLEAFASRAEPIPMVLHCPNGHRHVDRGEFAARVHHTHACQECGIVWRPAVVATVGVQFLPGFRDREPITREEVIEAIRRGAVEHSFQPCLRDSRRLVYPRSCTDCYGRGECLAKRAS